MNIVTMSAPPRFVGAKCTRKGVNNTCMFVFAFAFVCGLSRDRNS